MGGEGMGLAEGVLKKEVVVGEGAGGFTIEEVAPKAVVEAGEGCRGFTEGTTAQVARGGEGGGGEW